ncbi:hypothetical protein BABINDRAFT_163664 [Babjeviella inositovora NRRL Y-12698]|uniref:Uncharacterized protein n=1 Tax=Babjeviella inositovora NRRL Y-12698 TaxID=984486 RepID=A0A1E3QII9_9ASCO|nr:uncharacterized protein BABINDRAFT_163664 [Babjeviella inositovora NRRL Y-12698]ODQ77418.1 hypothetical protein BABINDRAFT_163664 [Babjeviella inositovora NRRL Y-12698]
MESTIDKQSFVRVPKGKIRGDSQSMVNMPERAVERYNSNQLKAACQGGICVVYACPDG